MILWRCPCTQAGLRLRWAVCSNSMYNGLFPELYCLRYSCTILECGEEIGAHTLMMQLCWIAFKSPTACHNCICFKSVSQSDLLAYICYTQEPAALSSYLFGSSP